MRIVIYRRYNDYIVYDGPKHQVQKIKKMLDDEGFRWYIISYGSEE